MQVQSIQNNNCNQAFGVTLKINHCNRDHRPMMENSVIEFLEKELPVKTKQINGHLEVQINGTIPGNYIPDRLIYNDGNGFEDCIGIALNVRASKETLLDKFINVLNAFVIREQAQTKINNLKKEIITLSDEAYVDSTEKMKTLFTVVSNCYPEKNDIAPKGSYYDICISRHEDKK